MKGVILSFYFIFSSIMHLLAQANLIPNPSFENHVNCPSSGHNIDSSVTIFKTVESWFRPSNGTPDFFHKCSSSSLYSIPNNFNGLSYQVPKTGDAYVGITGILKQFSLKKEKECYREYLTCKLIKPLETGNYYYVSFYVSVMNQVTLPLASIGCYFSGDYQYQQGDQNLKVSPQVKNRLNNILSDTGKWIKISGYYIALGGEQYLTIGNFDDNQTSIIIPPNIVDSNTTYGAYLYIDDVSLIQFSNTTLQKDLILCPSDMLKVEVPKRPDFDSCNWFDGDNSVSKIFRDSGKYWVTSYCGNFVFIDTFNIEVFDTNSKIVEKGICKNGTLKLTGRTGIPNLWSIGRTEDSIVINKPQTLWVKYKLSNCLVTDTFHIFEYTTSDINLCDTQICFDLVTYLVLDPGHFKNYLWKPSMDTVPQLLVYSPLSYTVVLTDKNNCISEHSFKVENVCPDFFYAPSAFSPNEDGVNDFYLVRANNLSNFTLIIFNRWGETVFKSNDFNQRWDGTSNDKPCPTDVYFVKIDYQLQSEIYPRHLNSTITLLR